MSTRKQKSKAALVAFNELLHAAGVLIEIHGWSPCDVSGRLDDVLHQIVGPRFIATVDEKELIQ